jgi:hypothetical protein
LDAQAPEEVPSDSLAEQESNQADAREELFQLGGRHGDLNAIDKPVQ